MRESILGNFRTLPRVPVHDDAPPPYEEFGDDNYGLPRSQNDDPFLNLMENESSTSPDGWDMLQSVYGLCDIPLFGHQYGVHPSGGNQDAQSGQSIDEDKGPRSLNPFEDIIQIAEADIQNDYQGKGKAIALDADSRVSLR
jgi:hypothetical protein